MAAAARTAPIGTQMQHLLQCDIYGQDSGYSERVLLIYDGALWTGVGVAWMERHTSRQHPCAILRGAPERFMHPSLQTLASPGLHYDALAVAGYEGAPESLDTTGIPSSGPRTDMVMEVGAGWPHLTPGEPHLASPNSGWGMPITADDAS